ncbi:MAG: AAA family ATPase, partial [Catenulispora sp.]
MLYGRDADCAVVRDLLGAARNSRSGVEVVRGEPGVGKSALLNYAAEQATGLRVLRGTGVESEVNLPFAALHQLLYPVLARLPALPAPQAAALGGAFGVTTARSDDPFLIAIAVLTLLADVSGDSGVLCLVDDAQWLDQASADALVFVARRLEAEGVVLLFGARDGDRRTFTAPGLPERRLLGLERTAAEALLEECVPGLDKHVRAQLVRRTAGNPLALLELPPLLSVGQRTGVEALPEPLPLGRGLERVFAARVAELPQATQHLLLTAAAEDTGNLATIIRAAAVGGIGLDALADAERAGLVTVRGGQLHFRHPLVRSAVYQHSPFASRQVTHRSLAAILRGTEDRDRRAWHLAAAALQPDADVAAALEDSADRARRRGGVATAADALERAAQLTEHGGERGRRLLAAAHDAWLAGQRNRAAALLAAAETMIQDPAQQARAKRLGGLIELHSGRPENAFQLLVDGAADLDVHTALQTLVLAGEAASFNLDPVSMAEVGRRALALAPGPAREDRLMLALLGGLAGAFGGDPAGATAMLREVVDGAQQMDDPTQLLWAARATLY